MFANSKTQQHAIHPIVLRFKQFLRHSTQAAQYMQQQGSLGTTRSTLYEVHTLSTTAIRQYAILHDMPTYTLVSSRHSSTPRIYLILQQCCVSSSFTLQYCHRHRHRRSRWVWLRHELWYALSAHSPSLSERSHGETRTPSKGSLP